VAERTRGMGRGLAAILTSTAPAADERERNSELRDVPVDLISPNPRQPRQAVDDPALGALAESLRERGVLQPVLVRPRPGGTYELIAGERRWRAARIAGFDSVPAMVRTHDDAQSLELALIENMAREDLSPIEEARACALLIEELGLTREEVGRRVGRSRVAVSNLLRLLELPDEVIELIAAGELTEGHGRALLMVSDHVERRRLARDASLEGWSVRHTEARAREAELEQGSVASGTPRSRRSAAVHPDQAAAAERLGDALGRALGAEVRVSPRGEGYRVTLAFGSLDEALGLAQRLGALERA
jgi:ParB family transcriptional regulator, chromosome partitioning protein